MKKARQNGFVLMLIIVAITLIGVYMFVLTGDMGTILFQTNSAYLEASQENLVASGLAWSEKNVRDKNKESFDKTIELDVNEISLCRTSMSVTIDTQKARQAGVQINTRCSRGRRSISYAGKYQIALEIGR